jgi:hypothetical protein
VRPIDDGLLLSIEDGLRATARDLAKAMPDDNVPPLPPPSRQANRRAARPSLGQQIRRLCGPVIAAAAVVAAVVSPTAIARGMALMTPRHSHAGQSGARVTPPYYVLVRKAGQGVQNGGDAVIGSTASGRALAVVRAPSICTFVSVTGGARSDRTFVLVGREPIDGAPCLYLLTFGFGKNGRVMPKKRVLPVLYTPGSLLAMSPDGAELAIAQSPGMGITIVTLATGSSHPWSTGNSWWSALSWRTSGHTLQYCRRAYSSQFYGCGVLDVNAAGIPRTAGQEQQLDPQPGQRVIGVTPNDTVLTYRPNRAISEFSGRPSRLIGNLGHIAQAGALLWGITGVLWTNSTGSVVIVSISPSGSSPATPVELRGNRYRQLPGNFANTLSIAW